jgi:hypothetical protein
MRLPVARIKTLILWMYNHRHAVIFRITLYWVTLLYKTKFLIQYKELTAIVKTCLQILTTVWILDETELGNLLHFQSSFWYWKLKRLRVLRKSENEMTVFSRTDLSGYYFKKNKCLVHLLLYYLTSAAEIASLKSLRNCMEVL